MSGLYDQTEAAPAFDLNAFLSPASFWLPDRIVTSAWLQHAPFAFWLMHALRPQSFVELGTHNGFSYLAFCQGVRRLGETTRCYAVDTWAGDEHAGHYSQNIFEELKVYHDPLYGDFSRLIQARFDVAVSHFKDGSVDLLHVDGRHFYADAKEDFETWKPKLSNRAVVIFHDTNVRERDFGVWRLWEEVSRDSPSFEFLHGHGLGVLGYGADIPKRVQSFLSLDKSLVEDVRQTYFRLGMAISDRLQAMSHGNAPVVTAPQPVDGAALESARSSRVMASVNPRLHIHLAAMAPQFLDVRTTLPLRELGKMTGVSTTFSRQTIELPRLPVDQPKVLVLQRAGVKNDERWRGIVKQILDRGWIVVAEIDDHPELMAAVHKRPYEEGTWDSVRLAHAVQTSTTALADEIRSRNAAVAVFPNAAFQTVNSPRQPLADGRVRVFFGALNRESFSRQVGAALAPFAAAHPHVEFSVVHDRAFFESLGDCSKSFEPAVPYVDYLRLMGDCDIALMPLEGGPGERFKSDIKWVEASSLGLATIASPVVYSSTVRHGVNGLLAQTVAEWPDCLASLVADPERRSSIAGAARNEVGLDRTFDRQAGQRIAWYESLWPRRFELTKILNDRLHFGSD